MADQDNINVDQIFEEDKNLDYIKELYGIFYDLMQGKKNSEIIAHDIMQLQQSQSYSKAMKALQEKIKAAELKFNKLKNDYAFKLQQEQSINKRLIQQNEEQRQIFSKLEASLMKKLKIVEQEIKNQKKTNAELTESLNSSQLSQQKCQEKHDQQQNELLLEHEKLLKQIREQNELIQDLSCDIDQKDKQNLMLQQKIQENTEQNQILQERIFIQHEENSNSTIELRDQIQQLNQEIDKQKDEIKRQQIEIQRLNQNIGQQNNNKMFLNEISKENRLLLSEKQKLQSELNHYIDNFEKLEQNFEQQQQQKNEIEIDVSILTQKNEDLKYQLQQLQSEVAYLQKVGFHDKENIDKNLVAKNVQKDKRSSSYNQYSNLKQELSPPNYNVKESLKIILQDASDQKMIQLDIPKAKKPIQHYQQKVADLKNVLKKTQTDILNFDGSPKKMSQLKHELVNQSQKIQKKNKQIFDILNQKHKTTNQQEI